MINIGRKESNQLAQSLARIEKLERAIRQIPSRINGGGVGGDTAIYELRIIGGNTLADTFTSGIIWNDTEITSVPTAYDPDTDFSFIDGIGNAELYRNNVLQTGNVLVGHYSGIASALTLALVADMVCLTTANTIQLPIDGTDPVEYVTLYVPYSP